MKTLVINGRTYRAVDEEGDDFSEVAGELRAIADNLENADYSEESRLEAIKAVMPLVGKMRKGISVNEEEDEVTEEEIEETDDTDEGFVATKKRCKKSGDEGFVATKKRETDEGGKSAKALTKRANQKLEADLIDLDIDYYYDEDEKMVIKSSQKALESALGNSVEDYGVKISDILFKK